MKLEHNFRGMKIENHTWTEKHFRIYDCYPMCIKLLKRLCFEEFIFLLSAILNEKKVIFVSKSQTFLGSIL